MSEDTDLIRQIAQGKSKAFEELYERYNRLVFRIALAVLGETSHAEEVTLDVFVRVWQRAGTYHAERGKVSSWLIAITRHHAIDILRKQKANPTSNALVWEETTQSENKDEQSLEDQVEHSLQRKRIQAALGQLPTEQRQALALAYFKGYSHSQIANILNEPLGTVKTRIRAGMQKLRQILEETK